MTVDLITEDEDWLSWSDENTSIYLDFHTLRGIAETYSWHEGREHTFIVALNWETAWT